MTKPVTHPYMVYRADKSRGISMRAKTAEEACRKSAKWLGDGPKFARRIDGVKCVTK